MEIVKLIIVDDHIIFRKGLCTVLNEISEVKVVGEASNGQELMLLLKKTDADIIFMDIKMPVMDGIETTGKILKRYPGIRIIALTMHEEIGYFNKMVEAGALGFLLKKTNKDELEKAIISVMQNEVYFSEEFITNVNKKNDIVIPRNIAQLSEREIQVLELICKGLSNTEISKVLCLSPRTVDGHRSRLLEKTGTKNAPHLVLYAIQHGLIKT